MTNAKALNSIRVKSTIPIVTLTISIILLLAASSWMLKMQEHSIQLQADKFVQSISLTLNADRCSAFFGLRHRDLRFATRYRPNNRLVCDILTQSYPQHFFNRRRRAW